MSFSHQPGPSSADINQFLTVSEIVEEKEVFEKKMKILKADCTASYSYKREEVRAVKRLTSVNMMPAPVINTMIKASLRMIGISLILLVTFLCLIVPSLVVPLTSHHEEGEEEEGEEGGDNFQQYLYVWKITMWVFFISRTLQPIIIVASDRELTLKSKQFFGWLGDEARILET